MAVDQNLKIELGKQGVFVTTIEELYNWGRRSSIWPMQFGLGLLRDRDDCDDDGALRSGAIRGRGIPAIAATG